MPGRGRLVPLCLLALAPAVRGPAEINSVELDRLRSHLLSGLDSSTPPDAYEGKGTEVKLQLKIFKVLEVDVSSGRFLTKVWRRMLWYDRRLKWNSSEFGGITEWCGYPNRRGGEGDYLDNNIWTPDIVLYNAIRTPEESLETGAVWVRPDGRVWYSVPGVVEATCRFTGLVAFPYDKMSCDMEFGSWSYSDAVTNLTILTASGYKGVEIAPLSPASGTSYQQYELDQNASFAFRKSTYYPCCAEPFSQVVVRVFINRKSRAYFLLLEIPGIMLTILSFLTFWLDVTQSGERLGFGVTLLLGNQLLMQISATVLPLCGEMLWIELFNWINFVFVFISILESVVAVYTAFGGIGTIREQAAEKLDFWARRIVPLLYSICIGLVYCVKPLDGYEDNYENPMWEGLPYDWVWTFSPLAMVPIVLCSAVRILGAGRAACGPRRR